MNQGQLSFVSNATDWLIETTKQARECAARAKVEAEAATRAHTIWEKLSTCVEKKRWFQARAIIEQEATFFRQLREASNSVIPYLEAFYRDVKQHTEELLIQLPRDMEQMAVTHQLPLDQSQSRHPRYKFREGFITVEIDEIKRVARINDYEEKLAELPPDIEAIAEVLTREDSRLFGRRFNGARFLAHLRKHYLGILKKNKQADGDPVPLRHIARRIADNERHFRRDEFLIDLSRLVVDGPAEVEGMRFDLQQTRDTGQGMLLHGPAGRGMVNLLIFRKEK